jgi:Concanavalin A-like lectin/glucanases superfamily
VFAITGLKIKMRSPFGTTMNIELANGSEGYIPPPEQHRLGGYTTWPARTAGLEVQAEPRIVSGILALLEQVAERPSRMASPHQDSYALAILESRPFAYWRLDDIEALTAIDSTKNGHNASYEGGVALYLNGIPLPGRSSGKSVNHAVHFAGGRLRAKLKGVGESYSVELWFWNGLATGVRSITGRFLAFALGDATRTSGGEIGIGGTSFGTGRLFFSSGSANAVVGNSEIIPKTWHHLALVHERDRIVVYLDSKPELENANPDVQERMKRFDTLFIGGRENDVASFEGKIDEVALFNRPLDAQEIARHYRASSTSGPATVP